MSTQCPPIWDLSYDNIPIERVAGETIPATITDGWDWLLTQYLGRHLRFVRFIGRRKEYYALYPADPTMPVAVTIDIPPKRIKQTLSSRSRRVVINPRNRDAKCHLYEGGVIALVSMDFDLTRIHKLAWIHNLWVKPEFRGQGLATAMLQFAEITAKARGASGVALSDVSRQREPERNVYYRSGYVDLPYPAELGGGNFRVKWFT